MRIALPCRRAAAGLNALGELGVALGLARSGGTARHGSALSGRIGNDNEGLARVIRIKDWTEEWHRVAGPSRDWTGRPSSCLAAKINKKIQISFSLRVIVTTLEKGCF